MLLLDNPGWQHGMRYKGLRVIVTHARLLTDTFVHARDWLGEKLKPLDGARH